jgi:DNA repair protein RadC
MKSVTINEAIFQVAEVELIYKSKVKPSDRPQIKSSKDAYEILIQTWDDNRIDLVEQFKVILMNRKSRVLGIYEVSTGGINGTLVDTRLVFAAALKAGACAIILSHYVKQMLMQISLPKPCLAGQIGEFSLHNITRHLIEFRMTIL